MKTVGIVCECNPFHAGHEYLIRRAKESGADCVIAVMSGYFVQRGEPAVCDAHLRAGAVALGGADIVIELPFPYSAAPAEFFAAAGVEILNRLGADELWFGSECGDLGLLWRMAELTLTEQFLQLYEQNTSGELGTAKAYVECLRLLSGEHVGLFSNDLLGIAYLRAILKSRAHIRPITVQRQGSAYLNQGLTADEYPSATALRRLWREEGIACVLPYLPPSVQSVYAACQQPPADLTYAERLILGRLRMLTPDSAQKIATLEGGLGNRLAEAARCASGLTELMRLAATKKYPTARLQRGILFALTDIAETDLRAPIAYVRLLAANATGCAYLSKRRKTGTLPVVTRRTELSQFAEARAQEAREARAYALYTLCRAQIEGADGLWRQTPFILPSRDP